MSRRFLPWIVAGLIASGAAPRANAGGSTLEVASLANDPSTFAEAIRAWGARVEQRTRGKVHVTFAFGGSAGDELTVIEKLRRGELHGAFLSNFGLGMAQPELRVFDLPFLVESSDDLLRVRRKVGVDMRARLADRDLVPLAWGEMGPVHLFSKTPIRSLDELRTMRIWVPPDDLVMQSWFAALGVTTVSLSVTEVMTGLDDGAIDGFCATPLIPIALTWNERVNYMTSVAIARPLSALVITRQAWNGLGRSARKVLLAEARTLLTNLDAQLEDGHAWALTTLTKAGLQVDPTPATLVDELRRAALAMRPSLDGRLYSQRFRSAIERAVPPAR